MKIIINTEVELLKKYANRKSPLFFEIWLEHNKEQYPCEHWRDFGIDILNFWISALIDLKCGVSKKEDFVFMDGPYRMKITYDKKTKIVTLKSVDNLLTWHVSYTELVHAMEIAVNDINVAFKKAQVGKEDIFKINYHLLLLKKELE